MIEFYVRATPGPQGSKRHGRRGNLIESSRKVKPWREAIGIAFLESRCKPISGPVSVQIIFILKKPKRARAVPAVRPDIDKLVRSTLDGLTAARCIDDDSCVVGLTAKKVYADEFFPDVGAQIWVCPAGGTK